MLFVDREQKSSLNRALLWKTLLKRLRIELKVPSSNTSNGAHKQSSQSLRLLHWLIGL